MNLEFVLIIVPVVIPPYGLIALNISVWCIWLLLLIVVAVVVLSEAFASYLYVLWQNGDALCVNSARVGVI